MPRTDLIGDGLTLHAAILLVEADSFILGGDRHTKANQLIAGTNLVGNTDDLISPGFPLADDTTEGLEGFKEEGFDEVGLELVRLHALHLFADRHNLMDIHGVFSQRAIFQKLTQRVLVQCSVDNLIQFGAGFRSVAIPDCLNEQFSKRTVVETRFTQNVKYLPTQRSSFFFQLFK